MFAILVLIWLSIFEVEVHGMGIDRGAYVAFTDSDRLLGDAPGVWKNDGVEVIANAKGNSTTPSYVAFTDSDRLIGDAPGVWKNDGVEVIANDKGNTATPSYVAFAGSDRLLAHAAENPAARNTENAVFDANRLIGRKFTDSPFPEVWKNDGVEVIANHAGDVTTPSYVAFSGLLGDAPEVWKNDGVEVIANDKGNSTTPSYVAFTDSDRLLGDAPGVWKNDGVEVIANDKGKSTTPSYVAFTDSDRLLADAAKNEAAPRNPENTVFDANRLIGRKFKEPTCAGVWKNDGVEVIANDSGNTTTPSYVAFTDTDRLLGDAPEAWKNDGVEVIANDKGERTTPSYVAFTDSDRLLADAAENEAAPRNPENTVFDANRLIGRKFKEPLKVESGADDELVTVVDYPGETKEFHPEEVSAMILAKMKEATEAYLGSEVSHAIVTVSATIRNEKWCLSQFDIACEVSEADQGREEQLQEKFEGGDSEALEKAVQDRLEGGDWLDKKRLQEKDELEAKQKKFEVMKVYQTLGGDGVQDSPGASALVVQPWKRLIS